MWFSDAVEISDYALVRDKLKLEVRQRPVLEGLASFSIEGKIKKGLVFIAGRTRLEFSITDVFGRLRRMAVYFDGHSSPWLTINDSGHFVRVHFVSHDGVRLRIASKANHYKTSVATIYQREPTTLYSLSQLSKEKLDFSIPKVSQIFKVDSVRLCRELETSMLMHGTNYDHGRLGAEIAYVVAGEKLHLKGMVLAEPSKGGNDLYTQDEKVILQARMLTDTRRLHSSLNNVLQAQLTQMIKKLRKGFNYYPNADRGYAILTYVDNNNVNKVIIIEVLPPIEIRQ